MRIIGKISQLNDDRMTLDIYAGNIDVDLIGQEVVCECKKQRQKRSMSANGYFWVLVGDISRKLGVSKDSIYKWMLKEAGVSTHMLVKKEAIPMLSKTFRVIEQVGQLDDMIEVICYFGSSTYDTAEFAHLIEVTRQQAVDIGCDVWTKEEIENLLGGNYEAY